MEDELEHIRENEGVVHTVVSEAMGYPCSPFIPDYELLDDASQWEDIEAARAKRTVSTEGLFRIRSTETGETWYVSIQRCR
ncbi:farnesyltransferase/geranylgeranyltransferase type-1 subunit alpha [Babesia caballi]|uniref:Farnesyltransferase/geranylgeranyltransferase type-1 subunit alpha n=1 Tax=Babesia caballi TaxID=5871 RepID=A0AAV4LP85_BABCB|nr:farnesyltransferase/geranylgeranyltransferase type-1 subunit alpha [Babesia caballi]